MNPAEFGERLDRLERHVRDAHAYTATWRQVAGADQRAVDLMNRRKGLFTPVRNALRYSVLMETAKLFDTDPRTPNFRSMLNAAVVQHDELVPNIRRPSSRSCASASWGCVNRLSSRHSTCSDTRSRRSPATPLTRTHAEGRRDRSDSPSGCAGRPEGDHEVRAGPRPAVAGDGSRGTARAAVAARIRGYGHRIRGREGVDRRAVGASDS